MKPCGTNGQRQIHSITTVGPGLHADFPAALLDSHLAPMPGHLDQNAVGDGLTGQARPARAEGHRHPVGPAEPEEALNLLDALGQNHRLGIRR